MTEELENVRKAEEKCPVVRVKYCHIWVYFLRFFWCRCESGRTLMSGLVLWSLGLDKMWNVFVEIWVLGYGTGKTPCLAPGGLKSMDIGHSGDTVQACTWYAAGKVYLGSLLLLPQGLTKLPQFSSSFCSLNNSSLFQPPGFGICHAYFLDYSSSRSFMALWSHGWLLPITHLICHFFR